MYISYLFVYYTYFHHTAVLITFISISYVVSICTPTEWILSVYHHYHVLFCVYSGLTITVTLECVLYVPVDVYYISGLLHTDVYCILL